MSYTLNSAPFVKGGETWKAAAHRLAQENVELREALGKIAAHGGTLSVVQIAASVLRACPADRDDQ